MDLKTMALFIELNDSKAKIEEYEIEIRYLKEEIKKYKALIAYAEARINLEVEKRYER